MNGAHLVDGRKMRALKDTQKHSRGLTSKVL